MPPGTGASQYNTQKLPMKSILTYAFLLPAIVATAQTKINQSVPVKSGQQVNLTFDYPELIRVTTWDKNEISIQAVVSINDGENDNAFVLDISSSGETVNIRGKIKDMENLPHRISVMKDGQKIVFRNESEWRKYSAENGTSGFDWMNRGAEIDITMEIKVPARTTTSVVSVYGMVEIRQFNGPLRVEATYGGVDASITEASTGQLVAETNYGHIYTDLTLALDRDRIRDEDFHTVISVKPGNGHAYHFESNYGNVYLRRSK
jgi:hypothetical protein